MEAPEIIKKGEHLTLRGTAYDDDGNELDVSTGYNFVAKVKRHQSDSDAEAKIDIDSVNEPGKFSVSEGPLGTLCRVTATIISSFQSNNDLDLGPHHFGWWAKSTVDGQEYLIREGIVLVVDSTVDTKS